MLSIYILYESRGLMIPVLGYVPGNLARVSIVQ
jgi:hypothetical protein